MAVNRYARQFGRAVCGDPCGASQVISHDRPSAWPIGGRTTCWCPDMSRNNRPAVANILFCPFR